jgi:peptidyl-dipeptidase Dcp
VLDADTVEWIKQHGGLTRTNGDHFRDTLLSRGGSKDALQLFQDFAGRKPEIGPLLKRRGLDGPADDSKQPAEAKPQEKTAAGG